MPSSLFYHIVDQLSLVHPLSKGGGAFQTGILNYVDMPNIVHLLTTSRKKNIPVDRVVYCENSRADLMTNDMKNVIYKPKASLNVSQLLPPSFHI